MNTTKLAGALTLAIAIGLPTAALASFSNQRDSSLTMDRGLASGQEDASAIRQGGFINQRDWSLSRGSEVTFGGAALSADEGRSARFTGEADRAHDRAAGR